MNVLLNSFLPVYLQCDLYKKMVGLGFIDMGELVQKLDF